MRLPFIKAVLVAGWIGCALLRPGASSQAASRLDGGGATSVAPGAQTSPTATLQVSGTATEFTISADHADVQSALKLVFDQAGKQFTLSNDVIGQVTLRLERQPLATVLEALCGQTFLRYQVSPAGIYQFSRNTEALHTFILRVNTLNEALLQRLQGLGLNALNLVPAGPQGPPGPAGMPGGFGGFAGKPAMDSAPGVNRDLANSLPLLGSTAPKVQERRAATVRKEAANTEASGLDRDAQVVVQPGIVSVRTLPDHPVALTDILQELSRQSHVPILIDPQVPSGIQFRFSGKLTAPSLPEWLDRLAPVARLQWYRIGSQIFVTTSPEFAIFFGASNTPRATFGMPAAAAPRSATAGKPGTNSKNEPPH